MTKMNNENKVLLWHLVGKETPELQYYQVGDVKLVAADICSNAVTSVHEVWHSRSGGKKWDDLISVGFVRLPYIVKLNEHECKHYKLSSLSINITEKFHKDWKLELTVEGVSLEHQKAFYPYLFIV